MSRPRVIIADEDRGYIIPLQLKFVKEYFNQIDLEIITDRQYFLELFSTPQKAEILILSDELYDSSLQKHNIGYIFVMAEQSEEGEAGELNINRLYKYTSVKEIFNEIVGKSKGAFHIRSDEKQETRIILVTSASGGTGKTTIAMGVSAFLTRYYKKRVLYLNASRLQNFQYMLDNDTPVTSPEIYTKLQSPTGQIYEEIRHVLRKESFSYLPTFKAALMSVGLEYSVYGKIALSAKKSGDFDFIMIDAESALDEDKARLLDIADRVIIVTEQSVNAVAAVNALISNINGMKSDKYIFICNKFEKESYNALTSPTVKLKFTVNEYVDKFAVNGIPKCEKLSEKDGIKKAAFLIL
ncbi:MAG: AAA family ATPase [Acetatifactor sp.]|nr:AAA family ATPase [Acetatifactor sp.]